MTTSDSWKRIEEIYHAALARPAEARAAFVREACGDDAAMRVDVESLLAQDASAASFLETPAAGRSFVGQRLGPYQVTGQLGAGGMGEVYRARDSRLGRDVAIKMLPRVFASDPDRLLRIEREARVLAALNHPHIGAIYGIEDGLGVPALVLELVEGSTLAERIANGALPLDYSLGIAAQIAEALEAAHQRGIIHRDLKPANVTIRDDGAVKVLDFGLAKALGGEADAEAAARGGTASGSRESLIVGTPAYMSPEQAQGHPVDERTDIWAFGCVLYEMFTGQTAFQGDTHADTIAAVLGRDPDWSALPESTPTQIRRLLQRCLEKDPKRRLRDIAHARIEIEDALAVFQEGRAPSWRSMLVAVASLLVLVALVGVVWRGTIGRSSSAPVEPMHKQITFTGGVYAASLSPDGRTIAFLNRPGVGTERLDRSLPRLMVQDVAGGPSLELARRVGTNPRWSPDGSQLIYGIQDREGHLANYVVSRLGGPARPLGNLGERMAWSPDGSLLAVARSYEQGFRIVSVTGEVIRKVPLTNAREIDEIDWQRSSDRLAILTLNDQNQWMLWSMTSEGKERRLVYKDANFLTSPRWARAGDVIYCVRVRNKSAELLALDTGNQEAKPQVLLSGLPEVTELSIAADGHSALMVRAVTSANLVTLDINRPTDAVRRITTGTGSFRQPRVSPDGRWIVAVAGSVREAGLDWGHIVKIPLMGGDAVPLTPGGKDFDDWSPAWSPDGSRVAFGSDRGGEPSVWVMNTDGQELKRLALGPVSTNMEVTWTPDGRIAWQQSAAGNYRNYRIRDLTSGQESFLADSAAEGGVSAPRFSPQGDRVAVFWSRRPVGLWVLSWPKRAETFLQKFMSPLGWSPDGQSIYARMEGQPDVWVVEARTGSSRLLASVPDGTIGEGDTTPDGKYLVFCIRERKADAWLVENFDPRVR